MRFSSRINIQVKYHLQPLYKFHNPKGGITMSEELMQRKYDDAPAIINASEHHMACLFLVDTSGSMAGEPIQELNEGLRRFKEQVCEDKTTREVLDVAVVEFNSNVRVVQPFVPVEYMENMNLVANGGTSMGAGLRTAIDMIDERYRFYRNTGSEPYCPWIVMITDGYPTDSIEGLQEEILRLDEESKLRLWSLAVEGADTNQLNQLCHGKRVLVLKDYDFTKFFDWVNKSMRHISVSSPGVKPAAEPLPTNVDISDWM